MQALYERLGIKPKFSTAFHPQTDGQTERLNSTLEQYLRNYVSHRQDNWSTLLDVAEFAYNNRRSTSTGLSPFEANYGYTPTYTTNSTPAQSSGEANEIADRLAALHKELEAGLIRAHEYQELYYNRHHAATPEFQLGDKVWLEATNIRTQQRSRKLAPKRLCYVLHLASNFGILLSWNSDNSLTVLHFLTRGGQGNEGIRVRGTYRTSTRALV